MREGPADGSGCVVCHPWQRRRKTLFLLQGFLPGAGPGPQELGRQPDLSSLLFQTFLY